MIVDLIVITAAKGLMGLVPVISDIGSQYDRCERQRRLPLRRAPRALFVRYLCDLCRVVLFKHQLEAIAVLSVMRLRASLGNVHRAHALRSEHVDVAFCCLLFGGVAANPCKYWCVCICCVRA